MDEDIFIIVFAILGLVSGYIMPWVNYRRINKLEKQIKQLTLALQKDRKAAPKAQPAQLTPSDVLIKAQPSHTAADAKPIERQEKRPIAVSSKKAAQEKPSSKAGFEQQFAARLPVWIGGVAIALAGFFLVKYSIDNNLLSPAVRVFFGAILGFALLYSANWVRNKPDFANGVRISQSLTGAGIAVLYGVSFAASRLYELVPMFVGFGAMAAVTATALILALRYGPPIALLGMAGGFLTPALLSSDGGQAFSLFIYLYFTASGLLFIIRKTKWWWLSIPTIAASLLWVIIWLFFSYHPGDSIWLGLFLLGISATIFISSRRQYEEDGGGTKAGIFKFTSILNYVGLGGTMLLMGVIAGKAGFGVMEWALFGLLALGGIGLAYFKEKLYGFIPLMSVAVTAVMLFTWQTQDHTQFALTLLAFAAIFIASGCYFLFKAMLPILWAGLAAAAGISFYLLAYYKLHTTELFITIPLFWGITALLLAAGSVFILMKIKERLFNHDHIEYLFAVFSIAATSFISLALSIELERAFLPIAISMEILAIAWINLRVSIKALRIIAAVLACTFVVLMSPQIITFLENTIIGLIDHGISTHAYNRLIYRPLIHLGVPAIMFFGSAYLLYRYKDDRLVAIFEIAAISLLALMGYYFIRNIMLPDKTSFMRNVVFLERGLITNFIFIFGLVCFWIGRRLGRNAFSWGGIALCSIAALRIVYFDMLMLNPFWAHQAIAGIAILNSLLLPFCFPILWAYIAKREMSYLSDKNWAYYFGGFILAITFALITTNVRHIFQGEYLNQPCATNGEIYTYSVVWLLMGIGILFSGIIKHDKILRFTSLGVIVLTVAKVFLYDASELEGLYRVFSFLGLGLSLIGLSYLYTRFVFGGQKTE